MTKQPNNLSKLLFVVAVLVIGVIATPQFKNFLQNAGSETTRTIQNPQLLKERQAEQKADQIKGKIKKDLNIPKTPEN